MALNGSSGKPEMKPADEKGKPCLVSCRLCNRTFKVSIPTEVIESNEKFPFTIVSMHVAVEKNGDRNVHTLVCYIDKDINCRHIEALIGRKVFITPYIAYNPNLLLFSCNKSMS